ncbi:hypothetical protein PAL_GLEAN10015419 [Pteropus alecto]|uniref:Uncharacterized protein n=1 Tax=Pteropus alecto TaxID=9402 RepID=L5KFD8_PTEAL|nr:hypothetical protein PAL_GLEAN10015419 [Pteropus alecto]
MKRCLGGLSFYFLYLRAPRSHLSYLGILRASGPLLAPPAPATSVCPIKRSTCTSISRPKSRRGQMSLLMIQGSNRPGLPRIEVPGMRDFQRERSKSPTHFPDKETSSERAVCHPAVKLRA